MIAEDEHTPLVQKEGYLERDTTVFTRLCMKKSKEWVTCTALKAAQHPSVHGHLINTSVLLLSLKSSQSIQCVVVSVREAFGCYWSFRHSLRKACSLWLSGWAWSSQSHTLMSPCGSSLKHLPSQSEVFVCGRLAAQSAGSATNTASSEHTAASSG